MKFFNQLKELSKIKFHHYQKDKRIIANKMIKFKLQTDLNKIQTIQKSQFSKKEILKNNHNKYLDQKYSINKWQRKKILFKTINKKVQNKDEEFQVNPYKVENFKHREEDYNKLVEKFGCKKIDDALLNSIEEVSKQKCHRFLRRKIFFAHRDLDLILNDFINGKKFYLYTGRGPSSKSMHLGHCLPFIFTKYLQQAFNAPTVIQITDDEKYFHKGQFNLEEYTRIGIENIKDILAFGFDIKKTFVFIDTQYIGKMYNNICKIQKSINFNKLKGVFGINESNNLGMISYPAIQSAPCFSTSFPHIFNNNNKSNNLRCLIPQGIDQDPYFLLTRDIVNKLNAPKPSCIHSKFLISIKGTYHKMSSSDPDTAIFLTDTQKQIKDKINKHAFSGGGATLEQHKEHGANIDIDVPFQYLKYFLENDNDLENIKNEYQKGYMTTGEIKKICIATIQKLIFDHQVSHLQKNREKITDQVVEEFMSIRQLEIN